MSIISNQPYELSFDTLYAHLDKLFVAIAPFSTYILILALILHHYLISYKQKKSSTDASNTQTCLLTRRSIVKYATAKAVPSPIIRRALDAAILAPNHHLTEPWRFYNCGPDTIEAMAKYLDTTNPKAALDLRAVPHIMVVTQNPPDGRVYSNLNDGSVQELEDRAAVAASVQNFMLSLWAEGVSSKWMTGGMQIPDDVVLGIVGADDEEESLVANVWFGYADQEAPDAPDRELGVDGVLTDLP